MFCLDSAIFFQLIQYISVSLWTNAKVVTKQLENEILLVRDCY